MKSKLFTTKNLALMAVFAALATVLAFFPHIHGWIDPIMEIEFSDLPVLLVGAYIHPVCGIIISLLKSLLHMSMTETAFVGEGLIFLQSVVCLTPFFFYRKRNSRIDLSVKFLCAFILNVVFGMTAGAGIVIPFLTYVRGLSLQPNFIFIVVTPYFAIRAAVMMFAAYLLCMSVHDIMLKHHYELFLSTAREMPDIGKPFLSHSVKETAKYAEAVAQVLKDGDVLELKGDLGAGKTTFTKELARAFGIDADSVVSPTFVLCRSYAGKVKLHHADLYRVGSAEEAVEAGILAHIGDGVTVIEWADVVREYLPPHRTIMITKEGDRVRRFEVEK